MGKSLQIEPNAQKPKYQQLIEDIIEKIQSGALQRGDQLPTINEITNSLGVARMTIIRAYEELRERGIVAAQHGKGYFVASTDVQTTMHIFVLFDAMNPYKEVLFHSLKEALGDNVSINLFFHYHDLKVFENVLINNIGNYNFYIVMPHFNEDVSDIVGQIPKEKLLILDIDIDKFDDEYAILYQDFERNIFEGLQEALPLLEKYKGITLFLSKNHFQYTPNGILTGFKKFCTTYNIQAKIVDNLEIDIIEKGYAYILFLENDIIRFINYVNKKGFKLGSDVGLLSYDDTPIKQILSEDGITTISNDFNKMGKLAGRMVHNRQKGKIASPSSLIIRGSL
ncbi:GntR family transcriptional regulator [Flectobacillus major]|uniref:GntR family transcriptional regulator n=1 Tax=Flectobacillus major TaxID=103 RepID=UPI00040B2A69|nr:GntR family transcriptional regulator [Flectobacillus major]